MQKEQEIQLVNKIKKGDQNAFRSLVNEYKDMVYSICFNISKNREDAEELAMDAFMQAYKKIDNFRGESAFSTWIYRIAYNLTLSKLRKSKLDTTDIDKEVYRLDDSSSIGALEQMIRGERALEVQKAINELDVESKEIINLVYFKDKKMKEVSDIMKLSESNVKVKLFRGRQKLMKLLEGK